MGGGGSPVTASRPRARRTAEADHPLPRGRNGGRGTAAALTRNPTPEVTIMKRTQANDTSSRRELFAATEDTRVTPGAVSAMMRRRDFLAALGAAAAWRLTARAQEPPLPVGRVPVIGYLGSASENLESTALMAAFRQGLNQSGYVEGHNVTIEHRWANGSHDRLPALAGDLIGRADVIATYDTASVRAVMQRTTTTPVVFSTGSDPVKFGLVANLARPGGNVTGVSFLGNALVSKRLELLRQLVPSATTFGFLVDPSNPNAEPETGEMQMASNHIGRKLVVVSASNPSEIDAAFAALVRRRVAALAVATNAFLGGQGEQLAKLALRYRLPTMSYNHEFAAAGGLISYGGCMTESFRLQGIYAARVLKGEKPADLPVQQVTTFQMVLNLKTAKALGLTIPETLLAVADEVIQ
jgi:putative ABC transport system substrate-binding protein